MCRIAQACSGTSSRAAVVEMIESRAWGAEGGSGRRRKSLRCSKGPAQKKEECGVVSSAPDWRKVVGDGSIDGRGGVFLRVGAGKRREMEGPSWKREGGVSVVGW